MTRILTIVLGIQVALTAYLFTRHDSLDSFKAQEPLLGLSITDIDRFTIEQRAEKGADQKPDAKSASEVTISLKSDKWVVSNESDFPAEVSKVSKLSNDLLNLKRPWPVAQTAIAAKKLKVTDEDYERKITFFKGDKPVKTLFVGTAPAYRKAHVRVDGENNVYVVEFETADADPKASSWLDQNIAKLDSKNIDKIIFPDFTVKSDGDKWTVDGIAENEQVNEAQVKDLVQKVGFIRYTDQLGTADKDDFKLGAAVIEYTVQMKDGSKNTYRFGAPFEDNFTVLKISSSPFYFKVAKATADGFKDLSRASLVSPKKAEEPAVAPAEPEGAANKEPAPAATK